MRDFPSLLNLPPQRSRFFRPREYVRLTLCYMSFVGLCMTMVSCDDDPPSKSEEMMMEEGGVTIVVQPEAGMMVIPEEPEEANPCESDRGCFPGRICENGRCEDPQCQRDLDCPIDRPFCYGETPESTDEAAPTPLRAGRCGDCATDEDCAGASTCLIDETGLGGICRLDGPCEGTLECTPSSRRVLKSPNSEVCLDRSLSDREPVCAQGFDCNVEEFSCPEGLICLSSGQCASATVDMGCDTRNDCGFGEVCRSEQGCGVCLLDQDCGVAQRCEAGQCIELLGACESDEHCLGSRQCVEGRCASPQCPDDGYGSRAIIDEAVSVIGDRTYRNLISCEDNWYTFILAPSVSVMIAVRQRDRGANLGLQVLDAEGRELGRSVSTAPIEGVRVRESAAPRELFVRVFQEGPASIAEYDLELSYTDAGEGRCIDDARELGAGDDQAGYGRIVRTSVEAPFPDVIEGLICPEDQDFICFELARGESFSASADVTIGDALLVGQLIDPMNQIVTTGRWAPDLNPENISTLIEEAGRYCLALSSDIEVNNRLGNGRYSLSINAVSPELGALCDEAERLDITRGRGNITGSLERNSTLSATCAPNSDGGEDVYTIEVTEPQLLVARLAGLPNGTLGDPVLSVRGRCDQPSSERTCVSTTRDILNPFLVKPNPVVARTPVFPERDPVTGLSISRYTLIVDAIEQGDSPSYQLDVELRPLAPAPLNDSCDTEQELIFVDGVSVVEASLDQAKVDVSVCGASGPDVTYRFTLDEAADVLIQATAKPAEFPLFVSLSDRCDGEPIGCGFGVERRLEAGVYHISLAGLDSQSRGLTELQVTATPLPAPEMNQNCARAITLDGSEGSINGSTFTATNDYELDRQNLCTRDLSDGGELVYILDAPANSLVTVSAAPIGGWDLSLYLLDQCPPQGGQGMELEQNCLLGSDGAFTETIEFTHTQGGPFYIIVDGSNKESGDFTLSWRVE